MAFVDVSQREQESINQRQRAFRDQISDSFDTGLQQGAADRRQKELIAEKRQREDQLLASQEKKSRQKKIENLYQSYVALGLDLPEGSEDMFADYYDTGNINSIKPLFDVQKDFVKEKRASDEKIKKENADLERRLKEAKIKKLEGGSLQKTSVIQMLNKKGAEERKMVGLSVSGLNAATEMFNAFGEGHKPQYIDVDTPMIGKSLSDTPYTSAQRRAAEMFGRLQSGGAINKEEEKRFLEIGPRPGDNDEIARSKLDDQRRLFLNKLATAGFREEDLPALRGEAGFKIVDRMNFNASPENIPVALRPLTDIPSSGGTLPFMNSATADSSGKVLKGDEKSNALEEYLFLKNKQQGGL